MININQIFVIITPALSRWGIMAVCTDVHEYNGRKDNEAMKKRNQLDPIHVFQQYWEHAKQDPLTQMSFCLLVENLRKYGNKPSAEQLTALLELMVKYTGLVKGRIKGRYAFPLSCGLGKTQSVVALIRALSYMRQDTRPNNQIGDVSITVCASKVEALCDIKRELMESLVPEEEIGLIHSYRYDEKIAEEYLKGKAQLPEGFASLPATDDNENRPFLLVTHNRVRGKSDVEMYNTYQGKPRSLMIWDESLFISDTRAVPERFFMNALAFINADSKYRKDLRPVVAYLEKCKEIIDNAENDQQLFFPELSAAEQEVYQNALSWRGNMLATTGSIREESYNGIVKPLQNFLTITQNPVRLIRTKQADGYLAYDIVVDPELENIVVLDASNNIRELVQMDHTIKQSSRFCDDLVSYEHVKIHQLRHWSGRHSMEKLFQAKKKDRKITREIADVVQGIPEDEGIIIFTFKPKFKGANFEKILQSDLKSSGVDLEATVPVILKDIKGNDTGVDHKPRFVWMTWGNETSVSKYSYCKNVIMVGVLHRSDLDLAAAACGQTDDLNRPIDNSELWRIKQSEVAHCLYQALSRGSCRITDSGTAQEMNAWFIHKGDEVRDILGRVVPKAQWHEWKPKYLATQGKIEQIAMTIKGFLEGLDTTLVKISTQRIKKELGLTEEPNRTFSHAMDLVQNSVNGWTLKGRSMARIFSLEN